MEDNVGTIVIGTKVNNKGLEKGLNETKRTVEKFDENNEIQPKMSINTKEVNKQIDEELKEIDKRIKNKELKIDLGGEIGMSGKEWDNTIKKQLEAQFKNAPPYASASIKEGQWLNGTPTKEELKELYDLTEDIENKSLEQLETEAKKRAEWFRQYDILQKQREVQKDMARYNEAIERLSQQYQKPELEFDVGIDETEFDSKLMAMKDRADELIRSINQTSEKQQATILNIADIEKQMSEFERENELYLSDIEKLRELNSLQEQGVQLTDAQARKFISLQGSSKILEDVANQYQRLIDAQARATERLENSGFQVDSLVRKYNNLVDKAREYTEQTGKTDTSKLLKSVDKLGDKFTGLVKKAGRFALALIGIRTLMNLITRSFNTLAQYNEELGTKMQQMRLVLAVALEPIINWIVNLLQTILSLINQIYSSIFGISLFGRASELWSNKMAKNMASGAGSAKEMKKQLAGFDEMNVLNDNTAGGSGGGGSKFEPWDLKEKKIPSWMQWILNNGDVIAGIIAGIATAILLVKLGVDALTATGIAIIVAGIVMLIIDIIKYLKDPTWENFGKIIRDIGIILIGIGIIIGGIPGIIVAVIGAIIAAIGVIVEHWDKIKAWIQGIIDWFHNKAVDFESKGNIFLSGIFEFISKTIEDVVYIFEWFVDVAKILFDGIIDFIKKIFAGDWKGAWESIKDTFGKVWDKIKEIFEKTIDRIKERFTTMWNWIKSFVINIGLQMGAALEGAIKGAVNGALSWVESKINKFIDMINGAINLINKIPGVSISKIGRISLPRLATGGIINQPGRGVPVGGAIAGEAGREGILPLTDRQAMAELGKEIGKWINIQATVPVNIGNRQVARVIQEINADREFAMNS